jgi:hypothetical protein
MFEILGREDVDLCTTENLSREILYDHDGLLFHIKWT